MISAYPLCWPTGWKRTPANLRKHGQFNKRERNYREDGHSWTQKKWLTVNDGVGRILEALEKMGVDRQDVIISTNVRTRLDGLPRAGEREPDDPGAAVYWQSGQQPMRSMAIDGYSTVADNLAALAATLEAMRAIERHGGAEILDRTFTGFKALASETDGEAWWTVLGCSATAGRAEIEHSFRTMLRGAHPDAGGSNDAMTKLNIARDQALSTVKE